MCDNYFLSYIQLDFIITLTQGLDSRGYDWRALALSKAEWDWDVNKAITFTTPMAA